MATKPIEILIKAKDEASGVFDGVRKKVLGLAALITSYISAKTFIGAVGGAADLEQAMSRVEAATGASAQEMQQLRATAEEAGATTKFTATDAAGALENLAKAGLNTADAIKTLPAVTQLAQAADLELAESASFVTKAVMGMGLAFEDAGRVADVLAKGANATNTSVEGLGSALSITAPIANSLGVSLESTVAILGKFADAGIDASRAGTALNSIMSQFADPASKFRQELAAAGITTTNFEDALHQLAGAGAAGNKAINAVGRNAGPALRALLNQGMGALDGLTESLRNANGAAAAMAATMEDNLRGSLTGLGSAWDTLKNTLATPVLPVLKDGVDRLANAFRSAVSSGIVEKFGQVIATAFEGAIKWVGALVDAFNFDEALARLQRFAGDVDVSLGKVEGRARTAAMAVKAVVDALTAGINAIMFAAFKIAQGFSGIWRGIAEGAAALNETLSKITFGAMSENFAQTAADIRVHIEGMTGVFEAFGTAGQRAFLRMADSAQELRDEWPKLVDEFYGGTEVIREGIEPVLDDLDKLGQAAEKAGVQARAALESQTEAATQARAAIADLRAEYAEAIDTGNLQRAAELLQEIDRATTSAALAAQDLAREQEEAAASIAAAFERAGVKTQAQLDQMAATARADFEAIRASGQASAAGVDAAWRQAAQAAIDAADGVAPAWVLAEASVHGYVVEVNEAGEAALRAAEKAAHGTKDIADGWREARRAHKEYQDSVKNDDGSRWGASTAKLDTTEQVKRWIKENIGAEFVDDERAFRAATLKFNAASFGNAGSALAAGGRQTLRGYVQEANELIEEMRQEAGARDAAPGTSQASAAYVTNITLDGRQRTVRTTDANSAQALQDILRELAEGQRVSVH